MAQIQIALHDTVGDRRLELRLPDDVPLAQLVPALARKLELPEGEYDLVLAATDAALQAEATLARAGVLEGKELRLCARPESAPRSPLQSAQEHLARRLVQMEEEEYPQALAQFTRAIELDPHNAKAYLDRGELYQRLDLDQRAIDDYTRAVLESTRAIKAEAHNAETYANRGKAFHELGLYHQALADYTRAVEIEPDPTAYHLRAFAHLGLDQWQLFVADYMKVIECHAQAIEREPNCAQAYYERAQAYRMLVRMRYSRAGWDLPRGRRDIRAWTEHTLPDYDRAIELEPDHLEALGGRLEAYRELGRGQQALADANRLIDLRPNEPWSYYARYQVHLVLGQLQQALADLDRVIELDPHFQFVYDHRSALYERLGRRQEADADRKRHQEVTERWDKDLEADNERSAQVRESVRGSALDIPSLRARVTGLELFERPADRAPEKPVYSCSFARRKARHVAWALYLEHQAPGRRVDFAIHAIYYRADGSVLADQTLQTYLEADWTTSWYTNCWGWSRRGQWAAGPYRVDLHVEDTKIATGWFEIHE